MDNEPCLDDIGIQSCEIFEEMDYEESESGYSGEEDMTDGGSSGSSDQTEQDV